MGTNLKSGLFFLAGLVSGAAGALIFAKTKWQKEFDAKQEEMVQYYKSKEQKKAIPKKQEEPSKEEQTQQEESNEEDVLTMKDVIVHNDYSKISAPERVKNESPSLNDDYSEEPYEIDGHEYGSQEMNRMLTLYLYDDGELRTSKYDILSDAEIEDYIGEKNMQRLADRRDEDPELGSFYVRNDRLHLDIDIEIVNDANED